MTYYNSAKLVIVVSTLVLLFGALPQGHAGVQPQVTGLLNIFQFKISGLLVCTPTGNPPAGGLVPGVVGAVFGGSCNGASGNISQFVTDQTGAFNGILSVADGILFDPSQGVPCFLTVQLPVTGTTCTLLPPTGILRTVLQFVSVVTNPIDGLIAIVTAGPWVHVP